MSKLTAIVDSATIRKAMRTLEATVQRGTIPRKCNVGWQGGGDDCTVHWDPKRGIWSLFDPNRVENRYWNCFGISEPKKSTSLSIECEINFPHEGINRRIAGVFAQDESGQVYVTHSGKIGGGRPGIGKEAFSAAYRGRGQWCEVAWADQNKTTSAILLGRVDHPSIAEKIAHFVREVQRFKQSAITGKTSSRGKALNINFSPEFSGKKSAYRFADIIQAQSNHGPVVQRLQEELSALLPSEDGWQIGNNRKLDLFLMQDERLAAIFEVKTDTSTTSIYTAIGQLMLHGAEKENPSRILVIPGSPTQDTAKRLDLLGVKVIEYCLTDSGSILIDVNPVLASIRQKWQ